MAGESAEIIDIPFFVGGYNSGGGEIGISRFNLDKNSGAMTRTHSLAELPNPSYIVRDPLNSDRLFVACEDWSGAGGVASVRVSSDGSLSVESRQPAPSGEPCHVAAHPQGDGRGLLFASAYGGGTLTVYPYDADGIQPHAQVFQYEGSGPTPKRQAGPRAHQAVLGPDKKRVYVCDLGSDRVWIHALNPEAPEPVGPQEVALEAPAGSGPRHMVFHHALPVAYILTEITNEILICQVDDESGKLVLSERLCGVPCHGETPSAAAAIRMHPGGNLLAASFRWTDVIPFYRIHEDGALSLERALAAGGETPRDFNFDLAGEWLVVAHQQSNTLASFRLNKETGLPEPEPAGVAECDKPVCVLFAG